MKINIKSKNATRKTVNVSKLVAAKKVAKVEKRQAYKGFTGKAVLLVEGSKGCAFRLAEISKDGHAQLVQNNVGLRYSGVKVDLLDSEGKSRDKQTRLELGDYIASRGERVKVKALTLSQADKLASTKHVIERNGKEVKVRTYGSTDKHYLASIEQFKTGVQHFFQWETESLGAANKKHYGAMIK